MRRQILPNRIQRKILQMIYIHVKCTRQQFVKLEAALLVHPASAPGLISSGWNTEAGIARLVFNDKTNIPEGQLEGFELQTLNPQPISYGIVEEKDLYQRL